MNRLRQRAEQRVRQSISDLADMSVDDMARLLYELEVHQEELQIQNEELRRVQQQLRESRDRYADLYDFAPVGYLTVDEEGLILEANLTAATMLGVPRGKMIGSRLALHCREHSRLELRKHLAEVFSSKTRASHELEFKSSKGATLYIGLDSNLVTSGADADRRCRVIINDITRRKHAEKNLKDEQQLLRQLLELHRRDGVLEISIRDKGRGFDPAQVPQGRFGLMGIRERARLFGGTAEIESAPGGGTTVSARFPS